MAFIGQYLTDFSPFLTFQESACHAATRRHGGETPAGTQRCRHSPRARGNFFDRCMATFQQAHGLPNAHALYQLGQRDLPQWPSATTLGAHIHTGHPQPTLGICLMTPTAIFMPALVLMLWTMLVLVQVPIRRFAAYFAKRVAADDFNYGESSNVPVDVALPNRIFMNLVEVPVLFYALVLIAFVTQEVNHVTLSLAWGYVALRLVHSLIYFTYNHVVHRFAVFATSNLVIVAMIVYLGLALA
ncbi:MAG: MAPEG family protein [Burkholderiaceae bacterium]|jgi:hypothetical protein|nr:MAPEG family protein [Burkholderiaceae bacterium]